MRQIALLLCILFTVQSGICQTNNFAPIGAKWWYNYETDFASGYSTIEVIGDTIIDGHTCRILQKYSHTINDIDPDGIINNNYLGKEFIYEDLGVVYNYRFNTFYPMYKFESAVGDSWLVAGETSGGICDTITEVIIESIGDTILGGLSFTIYNITPYNDGIWSYLEPVISIAGGMGYLFVLPVDCVIDYSYEGFGLRCYYDSNIGMTHITEEENCEIISDINEGQNVNEISIYPNPATNELFINLETSELIDGYTLNMFTITGSQLYTAPLAPNSLHTLDLANIQHGLLFVQVLRNNQLIFADKILHL